MDDECTVVALDCVRCGITFHKDFKYPYTECAICDPRVPHRMDEEEFEQRAEQLLKSMETDDRFYQMIEVVGKDMNLNVEDLLEPQNCDHCLKDFRQKGETMKFQDFLYIFCSLYCKVNFNPRHFIPREQRSFENGTKRR